MSLPRLASVLRSLVGFKQTISPKLMSSPLVRPSSSCQPKQAITRSSLAAVRQALSRLLTSISCTRDRACSRVRNATEQPIEVARRRLEIARQAGVTTILNLAPAALVDDILYVLCDYIAPNETEASALLELPIDTLEQAHAAANALLERGAGIAFITLGEKGAIYHRRRVDPCIGISGRHRRGDYGSRRHI
jgi:pfkB family carbohydrate kinase